MSNKIDLNFTQIYKKVKENNMDYEDCVIDYNYYIIKTKNGDSLIRSKGYLDIDFDTECKLLIFQDADTGETIFVCTIDDFISVIKQFDEIG